MAYRVDWAKLKREVSIVAVIAWLGIKHLKPSGKQLIGSCPLCGNETEDGFKVTPDKNLWNTFACDCGGGTIIDLVAKRRACSDKDAANEIHAHFIEGGNSKHVSPRSEHGSSRSTPKRPNEGARPEKADVSPPSDEPKNELKPLDYLTTDHEAIEALGLSPAVCNAFGIGYAPKGTMRGRVVFPLRLKDGSLCGYAGLATTGEMAPLMLLPKNLEQMISAPVAQEKPVQDGGDVKQFLRIVK